MRLDLIIQICRMLQVNRSIVPSPVAPELPAAVPGLPAEPELVDGILTELLGSIREMRCGSMAGPIRQGMSMAQLHVLWLLEHHGEISMTKLAELLDVSLSNATGLMDRMEERGLIERVRIPDDRRRVFVRPSAAGLTALEETEGVKRDRMRHVLARLDERQLRRALHAFRDFRHALVAEFGGQGVHRHYFSDPD
jgi:DNA-binding MarR family transcriptional regulator